MLKCRRVRKAPKVQKALLSRVFCFFCRELVTFLFFATIEMNRGARTQKYFRSYSPGSLFMAMLSIKKELPSVQENVSLDQYTSFKIGGPARFFYEAGSAREIIKGVRAAKKYNIPFFMLGGGSNILVSDKGFSGLVIKTKNNEIEAKEGVIQAGAGAELKELVRFALENSLSGLEWAAGIPGSVGGAIRGNVAAFDGSMAECIKKVEMFDAQKLKRSFLSRKECRFDYKQSVFKKNPSLIILRVEIKLSLGQKPEIERKMKSNLEYRKENHPLQYASAGCVFKNCSIKIKDPNLEKKFPLLKKFKEQGIIPAGYLIDRAGLGGTKKGGAEISPQHANFIVNKDGATAGDMIFLINLAKERVKEVFGVELEEEIQYLGF